MNLPKTPLMLRAHLLTLDGGTTFIVSRQYFLQDAKTGKYLDVKLEGRRLALIQEGGDDVDTNKLLD